MKRSCKNCKILKQKIEDRWRFYQNMVNKGKGNRIVIIKRRAKAQVLKALLNLDCWEEKENE